MNETNVSPMHVRSHAGDGEWIEKEAWLDAFGGVPPAAAAEIGLNWMRVGDGAAFTITAIPASPFNRAVALGLAQPLTQETLDGVIDWLRERCGADWALHLAPGAAPAALPGWLAARHLHPSQHGTAKFSRGARPLAERVRCPFDIREVGAEQRDEVGRLAQVAFEMPENLALMLKASVGRARWRTYLAYDGSTPVALGAMFIERGLAWLGNGATLPGYRRKGAQSALLARRIRDGLAQGVEAFTVEAGHAAGQEPGASHRNVVRAGFTLSYVRARYVASDTT